MAASALKITANRANAVHSTGPVDTSKTRFNGIAHGLTSKPVVIPGENQAEYDTFEAALRKQLAPATPIETVLAERIIAAVWRLKRFTRVEAAFFTNRIDAYLEANPDTDPDVAMANLFIDPAESARMRLFMRYQAATQREYDKAFKELQAAKAERLKAEEKKTSTLSTLLAAYAMDGEENADTAFVPEESNPRATVGFASHNPHFPPKTTRTVAA